MAIFTVDIGFYLAVSTNLFIGGPDDKSPTIWDLCFVRGPEHP